MPFMRFTASNGMELEVELLSLGFRLPGKPEKRQFSCLVQNHNETAEIKLAASFNAPMLSVKSAMEEVLREIGFKGVEWEHGEKSQKHKL